LATVAAPLLIVLPSPFPMALVLFTVKFQRQTLPVELPRTATVRDLKEHLRLLDRARGRYEGGSPNPPFSWLMNGGHFFIESPFIFGTILNRSLFLTPNFASTVCLIHTQNTPPSFVIEKQYAQIDDGLPFVCVPWGCWECQRRTRSSFSKVHQG